MTVRTLTMSLLSRFYGSGDSHASFEAHPVSAARTAKLCTLSRENPLRCSDDSRFLKKSFAQLPSIGIL